MSESEPIRIISEDLDSWNDLLQVSACQGKYRWYRYRSMLYLKYPSIFDNFDPSVVHKRVSDGKYNSSYKFVSSHDK